MSLCANGTPCSGPSGLPARWSRSAASAAARAPSVSTSTKQFKVPFSRPMRSRQASTTSRAVVLPAAIAPAVSVSDARDQSAAADQSVMLATCRDLELGGTKIVRINVEVDPGAGRLDCAPQLLELDGQFLDARGFQAKLRVGVVHLAHQSAFDRLSHSFLLHETS